jgi:hypothetical protein
MIRGDYRLDGAALPIRATQAQIRPDCLRLTLFCAKAIAALYLQPRAVPISATTDQRMLPWAVSPPDHSTQADPSETVHRCMGAPPPCCRGEVAPPSFKTVALTMAACCLTRSPESNE